MSLINKVIHDLEDRQAFVANNEGRVFRGLTSADNQDPKNKLLTINVFTVMLFLVASVSGTYALMENSADKLPQNDDLAIEPKTAVAQILRSSKVLYEPVAIIEEEALLPRDLAGIRTRMQKNPLKLDFSLSSFDMIESVPQQREFIEMQENITNIGSIEIDESNEAILLNLELTSETNYRAYTLQNPNRIVVEVDDAVFDGVLPDSGNYHDLKNIRRNENHSDKFIMAMDTVNAYFVKKIDMEPSVRGYILSITMTDLMGVDSDIDNKSVPSTTDKENMSFPEIAEYGEMTKNASSDNARNNAKIMYIDAQELYRTGKIKEANNLLVNLLREYAKYQAARTLLAQNLIAQGKLHAAEQLLKEGLSKQKGNSTWRDLYARLLVNKGSIDKAITVLASAKPEVNTNPDYFAFLAALYQKNEQHGDAIKTYREVLRIKPANSVWWMGLAISLELQGQYNDALYAYNRALRGDKMTQALQKYVHSKINYLNKRS